MIHLLEKRFAELEAQATAISATKRAKTSEHFGHYEQVDTDMFLGWCVKCRNLISSVCGKTSEHFRSFEEAEKPRAYEDNVAIFGRTRAVFAAAKEDFEGGYLVSMKSLIEAEVFDTELEQARELQASGYHVAAAVIAGVVLETNLRSLCSKHGIAVGKIDKMNADLTKAGQYNILVQKRITALAGTRNSAAHGNVTEFNAGDVGSMIEEVERLVSSWLS